MQNDAGIVLGGCMKSQRVFEKSSCQFSVLSSQRRSSEERSRKSEVREPVVSSQFSEEITGSQWPDAGSRRSEVRVELHFELGTLNFELVLLDLGLGTLDLPF
ncbi:MAG: hypothetical protein LAO21_14440 [Acidobacteriia bacterium]|nr:hypothetical protein [Terriglobia bacterium]